MSSMAEPQKFMECALQAAEAAGARGEVPVGAVVVDPAAGEILARAGNRTEVPSTRVPSSQPMAPSRV